MSVGEICARGIAQEYIPSRRIMDSANLALRAKPHGSTTSLQMDSLGTPTAVQHDETTLSTVREVLEVMYRELKIRSQITCENPP